MTSLDYSFLPVNYGADCTVMGCAWTGGYFYQNLLYWCGSQRSLSMAGGHKGVASGVTRLSWKHSQTGVQLSLPGWHVTGLIWNKILRRWLANEIIFLSEKKTSQFFICLICQNPGNKRCVVKKKKNKINDFTGNCNSVFSKTGVHLHADVMMWKCFPHYWSFVRGIHQ